MSEALDHPNRVFHLVHVAGLLQSRPVRDVLVASRSITDPCGMARLAVALSNCFAAAVLMPHDACLAEVGTSKYDINPVATRFDVASQQPCNRATTLQCEGALAVPFLSKRTDKGGNVTRRCNATGFHLAEYGRACTRIDVPASFRIGGRIVPQSIEKPDKRQFFMLSCTVKRPSWARHMQYNRLSVAIGCAVNDTSTVG